VALAVGGNHINTTYSGILSGGGSLAKGGSGTLILTRANTYTGSTAVNLGGLHLNFAGSGAPATNILSALRRNLWVKTAGFA
jgi:autotransporter-associated beta strand protein